MAAPQPIQAPQPVAPQQPTARRPQPLRPQPVPAQPVPAQPVPAQPVPSGRVAPQATPQPTAPQPVQPRRAQPQPIPQQGVAPAAPVQPGSGQRMRPQPAPQQPSGVRPQPLAAQAGVIGAGETIPVPRDDSAEEGESEALETLKKSAPAWLVSGVVHMLLIMLLAVWLIIPKNDDAVTLEVFHSENEGEELNDDPIDFETPNPVDDTVLTPQNLTPVEDPFATPPPLDLMSQDNAMSSDIVSSITGLAEGRDEGSRVDMLSKHGGDGKTEAAVGLGLKWLKQQQAADGSWSLVGPFNPYRDGPPPENKESATAMALLAFLGNGQTNVKGQYQETVDRGFKWLLKHQLENGRFHTERASHHFYTHGQCTIAVCELYAMTKNSQLRGPCEKAVQYILANQAPQGGWRYHPADEMSDTSVTGWVLMALQSAKMADLQVPQEALDKVSRYLDRASVDGGSLYGYLPDTQTPTPTMTAEALLCRQYLGWDRDDPRLVRGVDLLLKDHMPVWKDRDVYYWYYGTQLMHHMEGPAWTKWNDNMKKMLVENQVKSGREAGSWNPEGDEWGPYAGRLYTTCLSIYMLEVYYRHLPIYTIK